MRPKWHITIKKLYRKRTVTEQNFKKYEPTVGSNREPKTQRELSHCASKQLGGMV